MVFERTLSKLGKKCAFENQKSDAQTVIRYELCVVDLVRQTSSLDRGIQKIFVKNKSKF